jgi:hypothetical protein
MPTSRPDIVSAEAIVPALALPALTPTRHANAAMARAAIRGLRFPRIPAITMTLAA